jgi:UrcA family protein
MTKFTNAAFAAIALACLSSAAPVLAEDGPVQLNVSTRGLDLGTAAGLAELGRRVSVSARVACGGGLDLASQLAAKACRADLEHVGAEQIAQLASRRNVMVASATTLR